VALDVHADITPRRLLDVVALVIDAHPVLTSRFERPGDEWQQVFDRVASDGTARRDHLGIVDLSQLASSARDDAWKVVVDALQRGLHIERGPLVRASVVIGGSDRPLKLIVVIHHLVVDSVSWRILIDDLQTCCRQPADEQIAPLPASSASYQAWAHALTRFAHTPDIEAERAFWQSQVAPSPETLTGDFASASAEDAIATTRRLVVDLSVEETDAVIRGAGADVRDWVPSKLLAALAWCMSRRWNLRSLQVEMERHGREASLVDADVSRTVGWFTAAFPIRLPATDDLIEQFRLVREALGRVPNGGIGFGLLRQRRLVEPAKSVLAFNYLGRFDAVFAGDRTFTPARDATGESCDPRTPRPHPIECVASILDGRVRLEWAYGPRFRDETMAALAADWRAAVCRLAGDVGQGIAESLDYDDSSLTPAEIATIKARFTRTGGARP
jgi:non-ribosomal peptide synthase protein (TIGR01720 family)